MAVVRLCIRVKQCFLIIFEENLRILFEKCVAQNHLRAHTIFIDGMKNAVFTAEIRNPTFCRNAGTAEENNIVTLIYPFFQLLLFFIHRKSSILLAKKYPLSYYTSSAASCNSVFSYRTTVSKILCPSTRST